MVHRIPQARRAITRTLWLAIGICLLVMPLVPLGWLGGHDAGPPWNLNLLAWGIGTILVAVAALLAGRTFPAQRLRVAPVKPNPPLVVAAACVAFVAMSVWLQVSVFAGQPHLVDEMAQLFHARVLAGGALAAQPPTPPSAFLLPNTWVTDAGWISQYPPGHPALLAVGVLLGVEWIVVPLLGGVACALVFLLGRSLYGPRVGMGAAVLWATSSWVLFTSSSYMNHVSSVCFALVAWVCVGTRAGVPVRMICAGVALGVVAAIRPLDAIAATVPILVLSFSRNTWRRLPWMLPGILLVALVWALFNRGTTGEPLTLGYTLLFGREHGLGFHVDPWGRPYTPSIALANAVAALRRLHVYAFDWPIPAMLPLGIWACMGRKKRWSDAATAVGILAAPILYLFYWHSGFFRGPRFYVLAAPFLMIAMARGWVVVYRWLRMKRSSRMHWGAAFVTGTAVTILLGVVGVFAVSVPQYSESLQVLKQRPRDTLQAMGVDNALVLVPTSWGNRMLADLWGLGVKPGLAERAYRQLDTCSIDRVRRDGLTGTGTDELTRRLELMLAAGTPPVPRLQGWPDPSVRLANRNTDDQRCAEEMQRDLLGFTTAEPFLAGNDPGLRSGIIFARDLWERNNDILERFPGWQVWRYAPPPSDPEGLPVLEQLSDGANR